AASGDPFGNTTLAANGKKAWAGWPDVPEIEELRKTFAVTTDEEERKEIAYKINELAIDNGVVVPLGQFTIPAAYSPKLSDVPHAPVTVFWSMKKTDLWHCHVWIYIAAHYYNGSRCFNGCDCYFCLTASNSG